MVEIDWLEGYYGTLAYQLFLALRALPMEPKYYGGGVQGILASGIALFVKPLFGLLSIYYSYLDVRQKYVRGGHNKNYIVIALKA